ncbi:MAG: hypothetical protein AAGA48_35010 [Myxococcota bacterium]
MVMWLIGAVAWSGGLVPTRTPDVRTRRATSAVVPPARWEPVRFTLAEIDLRHAGLTGQEGPTRRRLLHDLRSRGLPVLGAEASGPDRTVEARFVLLGEVRRASDATATVRWQLVDRRDGVVTFEARTPVPQVPDRPLAPLEQGLQRLVASAAFDRALLIAKRRQQASDGPFVLRRCLTPGTHGRARVGRGGRAGAAVVVSPDGFVWAAAHAIPVPPAPIVVRTASGTTEARWLAASAELDVAMLAVPTGPQTPCTEVATQIPRAREPALGWHPRQGRVRTRLLGFRLHETPRTLVIEAPMLPGSFLFDGKGALLGLRDFWTTEPRVRPHDALSEALNVTWGTSSSVPSPPDGGVREPDPIFLPPVSRTESDGGLP